MHCQKRWINLLWFKVVGKNEALKVPSGSSESFCSHYTVRGRLFLQWEQSGGCLLTSCVSLQQVIWSDCCSYVQVHTLTDEHIHNKRFELFLPLSGSQCHAAACAACAFTCCPGDPPLELSVSCAVCWPHGQEAGGAGLNGTDAGNVQLHAGEDFVLRTNVYCRYSVWCSSLLCSQDSMLEFDGQPIDPAIVSAQPMKPAQNMDLPQMVCPPGMLYEEKLSSNVTSCVKMTLECLKWLFWFTKVQYSNLLSSPRVPAIATQRCSCPTWAHTSELLNWNGQHWLCSRPKEIWNNTFTLYVLRFQSSLQLRPPCIRPHTRRTHDPQQNPSTPSR